MNVREIRIDLHAKQGRFEGWGTSLAWWATTVGRWPEARRTAAIRQLFSLEGGGLGLTIARFNAGGGENPDVKVTMEARAVMDGYRSGPDAELDESADPGQRAVLRDAARTVAENGAELVVEVFGNSPPWWATRSGSVTGDSLVGRVPAPNLDPVFSAEYLRYLHDVAEFVERDAGVRVTSVSMFNEPTSRWWYRGGRQEGCHFTRRGIDALLAEAAEMPEFAEKRTVAATEEWSLRQAVATWDALGPVARGVVGRLNTHSYGGASRSAVRARAARAGIGLWMSEFGEGGPCGLELALAIVSDLRELAPSAWVLWQAVSPDTWGPLRLRRGGSAIEVTPKFDVFARFTRSIRPGMHLVGTDDPRSVAALGESRLAAVVVGEEDAERTIRLDTGASAVADVEVTIASAKCRGPVAASDVRVDGGVVHFTLPAGCLASVCAEVALQTSDAGGFLGSGSWWIEHESGLRLGLAAVGEEELRAGVRVAGVPRDDRALAQRWRAEACGDGTCRWVCEASGHQLDVARGSTRSGAHVVQWRARRAEKAPAHSRFHLAEADGGLAMLVAAHSGLALALDDRGFGVQRRAGEHGTRWRFVRVTSTPQPLPDDARESTL